MDNTLHNGLYNDENYRWGLHVPPLASCDPHMSAMSERCTKCWQRCCRCSKVAKLHLPDYAMFRLSRKIHDDLMMAKQEIAEHSIIQRNKKVKAVSESAAIARSILRSKLQQVRESAIAQKASQISKTDNRGLSTPSPGAAFEKIESSSTPGPSYEKQNVIPKVGDTVTVPSLGKQARVLKVEASKGEITVQASNIKLRLKLDDVDNRGRTN